MYKKLKLHVNRGEVFEALDTLKEMGVGMNFISKKTGINYSTMNRAKHGAFYLKKEYRDTILDFIKEMYL